jgi:hypothetical protein
VPDPAGDALGQELPGRGLAPDDAAVVGVQEPDQLQVVVLGPDDGGRGGVLGGLRGLLRGG